MVRTGKTMPGRLGAYNGSLPVAKSQFGAAERDELAFLPICASDRLMIQRAFRSFRPRRIWTFTVAAIAVAGAVPATSPMAQPSNRGFTVVETGRSYARLQDALDAVGDGQATIVVAPGTYRQCAVQQAGRIRLAAQISGQSVLEGVACEGKAALVLRGAGAEITGLTFRGIAVPDGNGAGIRLEQGDLSVSQSWFADSQQGILTGSDWEADIVIDKSTFSGLGTCENDAGCAHSIYVGDYRSLRVTRSRFERGTGGHYLKSRAARAEIRDNSFDDSAGRGTNYMIDLPAGGTGRIEGNWFVQGRDKENYSAFIAVGAEELLHDADGLTISGNVARFVPGLRRSSAFIADWTGHDLKIGENDLAPGIAGYEAR